MSNSIETLVKEQVVELNEERERETKRKIRQLIESIIGKQSHIASLTQEIVELKSQLKQLQAPEKISLEV